MEVVEDGEVVAVVHQGVAFSEVVGAGLHGAAEAMETREVEAAHGEGTVDGVRIVAVSQAGEDGGEVDRILLQASYCIYVLRHL